MKICCLIDSLNSGGAQRQMTWLIRALVGNGHDVRLLTYYEFDHYRSAVTDCGVVPENIDTSTKVGRFWKFRTEIRRQRPDAIISFLDTPNFIGLFAGAAPRGIPVIVSERNHDIAGVTKANQIRFNAFRLATKVVTNSYSQFDFASQNFAFLKLKLTTILNCVDLEKFHPANKLHEGPLKIIVAASVCDRKNPAGLIRASAAVASKNIAHSINWFGNDFFQNGAPTADSTCYLDCVELIKQLGIQDVFRFHGPLSNIEEKFGLHNACCLPSFQEGCPNVICEALASGLPTLVSNHGDMKRMIDDTRGLRFDPNSVESIADAIEELANTTEKDRERKGRAGRLFAEEKLSPERFAQEYESLLRELTN